MTKTVGVASGGMGAEGVGVNVAVEPGGGVGVAVPDGGAVDVSHTVGVESVSNTSGA